MFVSILATLETDADGRNVTYYRNMSRTLKILKETKILFRINPSLLLRSIAPFLQWPR